MTKSYDVIVQVTAAFSTRLRVRAASEDEARELAQDFAIDDPGFGSDGALDWQKDGPIEDGPRIEIGPTKQERKRIT